MASFIPATNTVRVAVEMNVRGHITVNVYHVLSPHAIVSADLTSIGSIVANWMVASIMPHLGVGASLFNVNMRDLTTATSLIQDHPVSPAVAGGDTSGETANNNALVASWRTGQAGRSFRGRTYFGGLGGAAQATANEVTTTFATQIASACSTLQGNLTTAGYELVVASFRHAGAPRATAVLTPPTSVIVNTLIDTQRRRMKGST